MGLMDKIKGEFIDIIEWLDASRDTMVWRFPRPYSAGKIAAAVLSAGRARSPGQRDRATSSFMISLVPP
jgi:hypothetical protein